MRNVKKWSLIVTLVGLVTLAACAKSVSNEKSGNAPADATTCTGEANGIGGAVKVEVKADADKIYSVTVTEHNETDGIGTNAVDAIPGAIVDAQSLDVDAVAGATITSDAIKNAVKNALENAGLDASKYGGAAGAEAAGSEAASEAAPAVDPADIPDTAKTCTGEAQGLDGPVKVEVIADENQIYSVKVTEQQETEGIGTVAAEKIPAAIVAQQTINVDAMSGATITSDAVKNAVKSALESAGIATAAFEGAGKAPAATAEDRTIDVDVCVVGAGGAGMSAAIEAFDAGKKVVILESQAMAGGNSTRAGGGLNAAKTKRQDENEFTEEAGVEKTLKNAAGDEVKDNEAVQKLAETVKKQWEDYQAKPEGYFDSPELFQLDTIIGGHGKNDPELVKFMTEHSADAIDWLDSIGAPLESVGAAGGAAVKRIHRPVDAEGKAKEVGAYLVPIFQENVEKRNIEIVYETTADEIIMTDGKVAGVHATGAAGNEVTVNASAVVIATGGFGYNNEMVAKYRPDLKGFMSTNAPSAMGQGIEMAEKAGADFVDMDQIQLHPTVEKNSSSLITEGLRGDGAILVNTDGKRFYDEVSTRDKVSAAEFEQPGEFSWLIIDQKMVDASKVIQGYIQKGYTTEGKDYKELAEKIEINAENFEETMNKWNEYVEKKEDPEFGRTSFESPLDTAPFYAIKVAPGIHHTMGGIHINPETEVLDKDGNVIPGLFAAGEVTGGVHGGNRLGGNAVCDIVVFGRQAGQKAAAYK
ncbi:MAG: flavocytochrome c [Lachnospiraceae bacterium]|nr:flavocytochrome c [Lachnospiraceae bacterium]